MNITGGSVRGFPLKTPPNKAIRPTQNQVRLAVFSMLESNYLPEAGYQNLLVADIYAGTGALGIEALSRGVQHVDFIEKDKGHAQLLRQNLHKTGFETKSTIITANAATFIQQDRPAQYDLIFLDPPYALFNSLNLIDIVKNLSKDGVLVYLHDAHHTPQPAITDIKGNTWQRSEIRAYGTTGVSFYSLTQST